MAAMLEEIAKFLGGFAILIAGFAWLARTLISQFFSRNLEEFKANIKHEGQLELQRLGYELHLAAVEHQYRAATLLKRRAIIIAHLYRLLQEFVRAASSYSSIVEWSGEPSKDAKAKSLAEKASELQSYYLSHRIYFPKAICLEIDKFWAEVIGPTATYSFWRKQEGRSGAAAQRADESWSAAYEAMQKKVPPLLEAIEDEFRSLIGVTVDGNAKDTT